MRYLPLILLVLVLGCSAKTSAIDQEKRDDVEFQITRVRTTEIVVGFKEITVLELILEVENNSEVRKVDFTGWNDKSGPTATLSDEFGNVYKPFLGKSQFSSTKHSLYPGEKTTDRLHFELPVKKAKSLALKIELAAINNGDGALEIPFEIEIEPAKKSP